MEKRETIAFMQRIKAYYQEFVIDDFKIEEWHKELKKYDANDVNSKFDEHLRSEVYGEQIPKLHFLTKYLMPLSEKGKVKRYTILCPHCEEAVLDLDFDKHYYRCVTTTRMIEDLKKYFNLEIDKQQIMNLSDKDFEKTYQRYLNRMYDPKIPDFKRKIIAKILYPDMEFDVNEVAKEMVAKE